MTVLRLDPSFFCSCFFSRDRFQNTSCTLRWACICVSASCFSSSSSPPQRGWHKHKFLTVKSSSYGPCMDGRRAGPWQSRPKTLTDEPLPKAWASQLCPDGGIMVHCCGKHDSLRYKPLPNDKVVIHTWVKISVCMLTKNVMFLLCKDFSDILKNVDTKTKVCGQTTANLKSHLKNVPGY